jgi:hypothetical protein
MLKAASVEQQNQLRFMLDNVQTVQDVLDYDAFYNASWGTEKQMTNAEATEKLHRRLLQREFFSVARNDHEAIEFWTEKKEVKHVSYPSGASYSIFGVGLGRGRQRKLHGDLVWCQN